MKKRVVFLAMLFLMIGLAGVGQARTWDFNADFSVASNPVNPSDPDGTWSYGYVADPGLNSMGIPYIFTLYDTAAALPGGSETQTNCWIPSGDSGWNPIIFHSFASADLYGCPLGKTALHPGPMDAGGNWASVARWTAKRAMDNIIIQGSFDAGAPGSVSCFIIYNGETVGATVLKEEKGTTATVSFNQVLANIQANDTIDFIVGLYDALGADTTPLEATITESTEQLAWNPSPADDARNVPLTSLLSWQAPPGAVNPTYDVYLVETDDDTEPVFTTADRVAEDITATQYDPDPDLTLGKHYFWRVDVTVQTPAPQTFTGDVWHFQTPRAPIWNLADAYTGTDNPDTLWSYGMLDYTFGVGPRFLLYENNHTLPAPNANIQFWAWQTSGDRDSYGAVNHNPTDQAVSSWGFRWKPYGINIQSATYYTLTDSSVVFTAPEAGYYSFAADFESMTDARGTEVRIVRDDLTSVIWSERLDAFGGTYVTTAFDGILNLAAGEKLYFSNPAEGNGMPTMVDFNCAAALVDPEDLPEPPASVLKLWLKADTGVTTSEGVVTAWADQSTSGLTASLDAGNPMLETGLFNNGDKPVIRFDGDDALVLYDNMDPNEDPNIGNPLGLSAFSIYVVGKIGANQAGSGFIANANAATGWDLGISSQQNQVALTTALTELLPPNPLLVNKYYLIACTVSHEYERKLYINGNLRASDKGGVNYAGDTAAIIGDLLKGDIAEIMIYQGVDATVHANTQTALIDKYALDFTCADQGDYFQADLNEDCYVNLDDVALLAGDWLKCNDPYNPDQCDPIPAPPVDPLPDPDPFQVLTWDYNADYPTATGGPNPNGQWTYGYLSAIGNYIYTLAPASDNHPGGLDIFWGTDALGHFGKNPTAADISQPDWPNGMFFKAQSTTLMNPATVLTNKTTARFTAPFEATYEVHAQFESGVRQGFATPVYILVNGVVVYEDIISGFQDNPVNNISKLNAKIALPAYGILDFALDYIPGEGSTAPTWPNGGFHIVDFGATVASSAYNPGDFPEPFDPNDYPVAEPTEPNAVVLIPMSPLQEPQEPPVIDPDRVFLTAMTLNGTDASGNGNGVIWNTIYYDGAWDMALQAGTIDDYEPNTWLSNTTDMMFEVPLTVGTHTFTVHKPYHPASGSTLGLNLYFDGLQTASNAGISVFGSVDPTGPEDGNPDMIAYTGNATCGWPYAGSYAGGGLTYRDYDKLLQVTIMDYVCYAPEVYNLDTISAPSPTVYPLSGPDGILENIIQISLVVEPFIMTCQETGEYYAYDFDEDCYINLADFAVIAGDWLKCNDPEIPTCTDVPN